MSYTAFVLDQQDRDNLLLQFKPIFPDVIAHHVTFAMGSHPNYLKIDNVVVVYGRVIGESVDVLLVRVDGERERPDGRLYHITWSLDRSKGAKPVHSNDVIEAFEHIVVPPIIVSGKNCICK